MSHKRKLELVLKCLNPVPDRIGSLKRGNIIDTIRRFLPNLAILAFSLPENGLRQPLYLVVNKSKNDLSLGRFLDFQKTHSWDWAYITSWLPALEITDALR